MQSEYATQILDYMRRLFGPDPRCELDYTTDIELLVAIILSAQCTDRRVNIVTKELFTRYKTVSDYANADRAELERIIHSTGFYKSKAANVISAAQTIMSDFGGKIPADLDELTCLAGVGRKTASVFLAQYHKMPAIAVDTHVMRVSRRLGLSNGKNPREIEEDLKKIFDRENWNKINAYLVLFGRYYCKARGPMCGCCDLSTKCTAFVTFRPQSSYS